MKYCQHPVLSMLLFVIVLHVEACGKNQQQAGATSNPKLATGDSVKGAPTGGADANANAIVPAPVEPLPPTGASGTYSYQVRNFPLFGTSGLPALGDITQGSLEDCYFQAGLVSVLTSSPAYLRDQIKLVGHTADGVDVYSITLFYPDPSDPAVPPTKLLPEAITISAKLLTNTEGHTISNDGKPLWSSLYEKAFAVLTDRHPVFPGNQGQGYQNINTGGNSEGLQAISGMTLTGTAFLGYNVYPDKNAIANPDITQILNDQASGKSVLLTTLLEGGSANLQNLVTKWSLPFNGSVATLPSGNGLVTTADGQFQIQYNDGTTCTIYTPHEYALLGYNPDNKNEVMIRNPWGVSAASERCGGLFPLTLADYHVLVGEIAVVDLKK